MTESVHVSIVILGAGPTGLGAAHALDRAGFDDWVLLEQSDCVGGLSRSFLDDHRFTWDLGGHVVFSHYDRFTRLLDELLPCEAWLNHERECWIRIGERWVPYPFQNNIHRLTPELCRECLEGLKRAAETRSDKPYANFEEFIRRTLGEGIARVFMVPYNRKVWAYDPVKMGAGWVGERVSLPDLDRVERNVCADRDDVGWGPNNRFRFPLVGGTGAIWEALARTLPSQRIQLNSSVTAVDPREKIVTLADGRVQAYDKLISTIPLDLLCQKRGRESFSGKRGRESFSGLLHSSVHIVGVGISGTPSADLKTKCWMYFPGDHSPFYRVTHFSHYSPRNVTDPERNWSLMAEVSESGDKPVDASCVVADTVRGLVAEGLLDDPARVTHTWTRRVEYGYPTPTPDRDRIVRPLLEELREEGILSRGRFGGWRYEVANMDHSFMQGVEAAEFLLSGTPEVTLFNPDLVNAPKPSTPSRRT